MVNEVFLLDNFGVKTGSLDSREKAYILDRISGSSFYCDEFGELSFEDERKLIVSIFSKIQ